MACLNFIMYTLNIICWMMGGTMLGIGVWMAVDTTALEFFGVSGTNEDLYWGSVYTIIAIGSAMFLIGFFGCWGACNPKERHFSLYLYIVLVIIAILAEIVVVILMAVFWGALNSGAEYQMAYDVRTSYVNETHDDDTSNAWNNMQIEWKCCGSIDYKDYQDSKYQDSTGNSVPWTCCTMMEGGRLESDVINMTYCRMHADNSVTNSEYLHTKGCFSSLYQFFEEKSIILICITCVFAALEVLGLIFAGILLSD